MLGHYLPQMYLNRFTCDGRLFVFDRKTGKLRRDGVRSVAAISDYYVLTTPSGDRDDSVESGFLADLETAAAPALERLGRCEAISDHEHGVLAVFFAILCTRVPAFEKSHAELNDQLGKITLCHLAGTPSRAADFLARRRRTLPYSPGEFSEFVNSDKLTFPLDQNERVRFMMQLAEPLVAGFEGMDWWLLRATGKRRFITSDGPLGFIPLPAAPPTYGELTPDVLKFVAIDSDVCLMLATRRRDLPFLTVKDAGDDDVAVVNAAIAHAAERLLIARGESELKNVLDETNLANDPRVPMCAIVVWDEETYARSFMLSVRVHFDTVYPLELPIEWECEGCGMSAIAIFVVAEGLTPHDPACYTAWLDTPCTACGRTPRETRSCLSGEEPFDLVPPTDDEA